MGAPRKCQPMIWERRRRNDRALQHPALDQLRVIAKHFLDQATAEGKKTKANMRWLNDCLDRAARVLRDIVPYEHPKLSAVKLGGDPNAPLNLSSLSDAELAYFRRIMVKIGATDGPG